MIKLTTLQITILGIILNFILLLAHYNEPTIVLSYLSSIDANLTEFDNTNNDVMIIYDVTLIDVVNSIPRNNVAIIINENNIDNIIAINNNHDRSNIGEFIKNNSHAILVNATGKYLIPGLIDMHAHVAGVLENSFNYSLAVETLSTLLDHGVTTIRNPGGPTEKSIDLRESISSNEIHGPQILTAGELLNSPQEIIPFVEKKVSTEKEIRTEVKKQANMGVDFIKLYVGLTPNLVSSAIDEAHLNGIRVIGHLYSTSWADSANMGIDYLTHGVPVDPSILSGENNSNFKTNTVEGPFDHFSWLEMVDLNSQEVSEMVESLSRNNVTVDPTLSIYEAMLSDHPNSKHLWNKIMELTKKMYDSDVNIMAGTDIPNFGLVPGKSLHHELELLVGTGIPQHEVIRIATINAARSLELEDEIGAIELNRQADMVILSSNPLDDIRNTQDIYMVINNGKIIDNTLSR
ncbi:amidohydrolase family protein [Candidatus Nitrosocosmicus hydrocola]|uniref:amidohydrolase family protein n=1 Tax=Candidatus Nitrosocosmicus hydrocola TaxID=1826872 RepID=UPI000AAE444A|nr:amidohydrolase family protein [Candidatus Nitrosocosmicus hydrocola]